MWLRTQNGRFKSCLNIITPSYYITKNICIDYSSPKSLHIWGKRCQILIKNYTLNVYLSSTCWPMSENQVFLFFVTVMDFFCQLHFQHQIIKMTKKSIRINVGACAIVYINYLIGTIGCLANNLRFYVAPRPSRPVMLPG